MMYHAVVTYGGRKYSSTHALTWH